MIFGIAIMMMWEKLLISEYALEKIESQNSLGFKVDLKTAIIIRYHFVLLIHIIFFFYKKDKN